MRVRQPNQLLCFPYNYRGRRKCSLTGDIPTLETCDESLAGRDLTCWFPTNQPCHVAMPLEVANAGSVLPSPVQGLRSIRMKTTQRTEAEVWLSDRGFRPFNGWHPWDGPRSEVLEQIRLRDEFIARYGYAILTSDAIGHVKKTLGTGGRILEVGSGDGYWSYEFQRAGMDCLATDPGATGYMVGVNDECAANGHVKSRGFVDVHVLTGLQAVERYGHDRALMMVWPGKRFVAGRDSASVRRWAPRALRRAG